MEQQTEDARIAHELRGLSARELLTRMELSLEELRRRGIVRSRNAPLADVSERLVWIARGGTLEPQSMKSHDVTTEAGQKIQVKARIMKTPSGMFSQFRSFGFDTAVFLVFAPVTVDLLFARELTAGEVTSAGARSEWVNATTLTGAKVLTRGADVTDEMREAYRLLDTDPGAGS